MRPRMHLGSALLIVAAVAIYLAAMCLVGALIDAGGAGRES